MEHLTDLKESSSKIEVGGQVLYVRFDLNALAQLEDEYGSLDAAFEFDPKTPMIKKIRRLLYVGLQANHPEFDETDVGVLFTMQDLDQFKNAIQSAVKESMPTISEGELPKGTHGKKHQK